MVVDVIFEIDTRTKVDEVVVTPSYIVIKDHSLLSNLDYQHSGHIGFASSQDIVDVNSRIDSIMEELSFATNEEIDDIVDNYFII